MTCTTVWDYCCWGWRLLLRKKEQKNWQRIGSNLHLTINECWLYLCSSNINLYHGFVKILKERISGQSWFDKLKCFSNPWNKFIFANSKRSKTQNKIASERKRKPRLQYSFPKKIIREMKNTEGEKKKKEDIFFGGVSDAPDILFSMQHNLF